MISNPVSYREIVNVSTCPNGKKVAVSNISKLDEISNSRKTLQPAMQYKSEHFKSMGNFKSIKATNAALNS